MNSIEYDEKVDELQKTKSLGQEVINNDSLKKDIELLGEEENKAKKFFQEKSDGKEPPIKYINAVRTNVINDIVSDKAIAEMNEVGREASIKNDPDFKVVWDDIDKGINRYAKNNNGVEPPENYINGIKKNVFKAKVANDIIMSMVRDGKEKSIEKYPTAAKIWKVEARAVEDYKEKHGLTPNLKYTNAIRKNVVNKSIGIEEIKSRKQEQIKEPEAKEITR